MDRFAPGTLVCSNDLYHARTKRHITGIVLRTNTNLSDTEVIVRWISQTGDGFNLEMDNQMVIMQKKHLRVK